MYLLLKEYIHDDYLDLKTLKEQTLHVTSALFVFSDLDNHLDLKTLFTFFQVV